MKPVPRPILILLMAAALGLAGLSAMRLGKVLFSGGLHTQRTLATAVRLVDRATVPSAEANSGLSADQARSAVRDHVQTMPLDPAGHLLSFQLARFAGDDSTALQALLRCTLARPADPRLAYNFGTHLLEGGQFRQGLDSLRRSLQLDDEHLDAIFLDCMNIFARRYDAFRFVFPEDTEIRERLGELLRHARLVDESIEEYRWCLTRKPDSAILHFKLSLVYREVGQIAAALGAVEDAISLAPNRSEYRCDQGEYLLRLGRTGEALDVGRSLVSAEPGFEDGHILLARCQEEQGEIWEAITVYREALWKVGEKGVIQRLLGDLYLEVGEYAMALAAYQASQEEAISDFDRKFALYRTGNCYEKMGLGQKALEALTTADAIRPKSKGLDRPVAEAIQRISSGG